MNKLGKKIKFVFIFYLFATHLNTVYPSEPNIHSLCTEHLTFDVSNFSKIHKILREKTKAINPFIQAGADPVAIGLVNARFSKFIPHYHELAPHIIVPKNPNQLIEAAKQAILEIVQSSKSDDDQIFSAIEALRRISILSGKIRILEKNLAASEQSITQEEEQVDKNSPLQELTDDPWGGEIAETYNPENNTPNFGERTKKNLLTLTSANTSGYYPSDYFEIITKDGFSTNSYLRPQWPQHSDTHQTQIILTYNKSRRKIIYPEGYLPLPGIYQTENTKFQIKELSSESFEYEILSGPIPRYLVFPLRNIQRINPIFDSPQNLSAYQLPTGLDTTQWPEKYLTLIHEMQKKQLSPDQIADQLEKFIHENVQYIAESKILSKESLDLLLQRYTELKAIYPKPIAMAHAGAAKCDGAAWIYSSILRDFFQIPTRIVVGRTRSTLVSFKDTLWEGVESGVPHHAWIEYWNGIRWVRKDPTPPHELLGNLESQEVNKRNEKRNEIGGSEATKLLQELEKTIDFSELAKKLIENVKNKTPENSRNPETMDKIEDEKIPQEDTNSSRWQRQFNAKAIWEKTFLLVEIWVIEQAIQSSDPHRSLQDGIALIKKLAPQDAHLHIYSQKTLTRLESAFEFFVENMPLSKQIYAIRFKLTNGLFREAWLQLSTIQKFFNYLQNLRKDSSPASSSEIVFIEKIKNLADAFQTIIHAHAQEYELAERLMKRLPGTIAAEWVNTHYGDILNLNEPGRLVEFYQDLTKATKLPLAPLVRMALLAPFAQAILRSNNEPGKNIELLLEASPIPKRKNDDLVIAKSIDQFGRFIFDPKPGQHLFSEFIRGTQIALGTRESQETPDPMKPIRRTRTFLLRDVSPSMFDNNEFRIVDALTQDILSIEHAKRGTDGEQLSHVCIMDFAERAYIKKAVWVRSDEDFHEKIDYYMHNETTSNGSGTDIGSSLAAAYALTLKSHRAAEAQMLEGIKKNSYNKPFDSVNIILITDCDDPSFDSAKIDKIKKHLPPNVQITINLIAVGGKNKKLFDIARSSIESDYLKNGLQSEDITAASNQMVKEISSDDIRRIMQSSHNPNDLIEGDAFITTQSELDKVPFIHKALLEVQSAFEAIEFAKQNTQNYDEKLLQLYHTIELMPSKSEGTSLDVLSRLIPINHYSSHLTELPTFIRKHFAYQWVELYLNNPFLSERIEQLTAFEKEKLLQFIQWAKNEK